MEFISPGSYWHETASDIPSYPRLEGDARADVAVLGAGITGLTAALILKNAGKQVAVLEAGRVGTGTTGGTSGHLDSHPDEGFTKLIRTLGEDAARTAVQSRLAAIDQIETWCRDFGIDCDFRRIPAYLYTESPSQLRELEKQCDAANRLGLAAAMADRIPIPFPCAGGFRLDGQGRFHALRYIRALAERVHGDGGTIYEHSRAVHPPEDGNPCTIETPAGRLRADVVLVATHSAFFGISQLDMRLGPYQSYVMTVRVDQPIDDALFWDDAEPYHYTRLASSGDPGLLIVGGADHKTGQADERQHYLDLEEYVRRRLSVKAIEHRWSAELFEPDDGVPFIGRLPTSKHLYVATGFSGTGLTWGTAAGRLLSDLLLDRENPLAAIVAPSRIKPFAEAAKFLSENLNVARRFVADRFGGERVESLAAIPPGEGRLVQYKGRQLAVYRDENGLLHAHSPVCTHAGCIVQWNQAEHTWDCPCHGGRYTPLGERLYGPPPKSLGQEPLEK